MPPERLSALEHQLPWAFEAEHLAWQSAVRDFCVNRVAPGSFERNTETRFDPQLVLEAGKLGMYGILGAPEFGGSGGDLRTMCLTIEELAAVDSSMAVTVNTQAICVALLSKLLADKPELAADILPGAISGEKLIAIGVTEPSGGTDAGSLQTTARRDGDGWVINGAKQFITNSGTELSAYIMVLARTGDTENGRTPAGAFLVPLSAQGVEVGASYHKLGWRASDTHPVYFDDVRVDDSALLSANGYKDVLSWFTWARFNIAAMGAGLARGCLEDTRRFIDGRESFGRPLGAHQAVAFKFSDMAALVTQARLVAFDGAWKYDHGHPYAREAAIAKLVASEAANQIAYMATQLQGGYGFMTETASTRHYQDARILTIGEGTSEAQRMLIARSYGLPV
jgi:alkylation response protein AidB-like acyl-CoA dehydrogenase